ncbi:MAG: homoserine dehydrogenase [Chloroflexi bacterium]|nr:homoserine dehydrogenase [Chloroflexota bacterium]
MSNPAILRVAILGTGTVGAAVVRGLLGRPGRLAPADGARLELVAVAERDAERAIAAGVPAGLLTDDPARLVCDPAIDVVVELLGGDEPARSLVAAALEAGKGVVTANKHVIAHHGSELEALARGPGGALRFEAAVGGGIPILSPLAADLAANDVRQVRGIVNGTTNYILTAMRDDGRDFATVLAEAQERGYAEADPRGDVEGDDAVNKIVILARLAFGAWLRPESVSVAPATLRGLGRPGITGVSGAEMAAAARLGLCLKLVAIAEAGGAGRPTARVLPSALDRDAALGRTDGVLNRVEIVAEPVGTVAFAGRGAGGEATSSAVLGDLLALARGLGSTWAGLPPALAAADDTRSGVVAPPDAGPRTASWFAFLPGTDPAAVRAAADGLAAVEAVAGGAAVRTAALPLAEARALLLAAGPAIPGAPLYEVLA